MNNSIVHLSGRIFVPFADQSDKLLSEIDFRFSKPLCVHYGDAVHVSSVSVEQIPYWCACALLEPVRISFNSISDGAQILREMQRNWAGYQFMHFRRASLIQAKLPYMNTKEKQFPFLIPQTPIGAWILLDQHTMIASAKTSSPLPLGFVHFVEDHVLPPSRAYLKLQEAISFFQYFFDILPHAGDSCFDAGAAPGGWTWVLMQLGCKIFAVDRSELAENLMKNPCVHFKKHDAFTLKPQDVGSFDWVLSDVICYPARLLEWVQSWIASGLCANMICTIKMQGETDWKIIDSFATIPNARVLHLNYNKHELTFLYKKPL